MTRVWDDTRFKGADLLILLCLADHANDEGICWPSYQTLAKRARCSRRQAIRCVAKLAQEGWVRIEHVRIGERMNKSNRFHLCMPSDMASPVTNEERGGDILEGCSDTHDTRVVTPVSPKPSGNHKRTVRRNLVSSQARTREGSPSDLLPSIEDAEEHVCYSTALDFSHASMCAERWLKSVQGMRLTDWKAHLSAFADKYECDYRQ